ncbi:MAG TPA: peptidase E [Acidimicrobiales bacterium]|jgi:peptidase E
MTGHILPTGAGRVVMDKPANPLHRYTLELTGKERPRVLFIGTASGDDPTYIVSFYSSYHVDRCLPSHLRLFHISEPDIRAFILKHDVITVGGGNTANMLDVWRRHGVDSALREAWEQGAVMTGGSAGGLCWFKGGTTDSFGPAMEVLVDGLGFLDASFCPHFDAEDQRRPLFNQAILDGVLPAGYAADNEVALHFEGTEYVGAISSSPKGQALRTYIAEDGKITEEPLEVEVLTA